MPSIWLDGGRREKRMAPDAKNIETQHDMGLFYHCTPYREKGQYMVGEFCYKIIIIFVCKKWGVKRQKAGAFPRTARGRPWPTWALFGTEQPVAGIPQAGDDIAVIVEALIHRSHKNIHV